MEAKKQAGYGTGRDALLAATVHVVARKGLRGLTFRAVAELAGVNNTLVVHHFGTRDSLIEAALEWSVRQSIGLSRLEELPASEEEFCDSIMALFGADPDLQIFQYEMILEARRRPELAPAVARLYESYIDALGEGLRKAGLSAGEGAAQATFAALDGLVLQLLAGGRTDGMKAAIRYLWNSLGGRLATSATQAG